MAADPIGGTNAQIRFLMWLAVRSPIGWWVWRQQAARAKALNPEWTGRPEGWPTPAREPELFQAP